MAMASPDHDVSRGGGDVGPHRHLEDQTDHLLFFCHLSSRGAKHYSHASWSLRSPCGICYFAPNICSSLLIKITASAVRAGAHRNAISLNQLASATRPASRVIPVSLLIGRDGLIHFEERPLDHRLGQSVPLQYLIIEPHQHFERCERCLPKVLV